MLRVYQWLLSTDKTSSRVFYCQLRRLQICHCVQLNALFCCLRRNVEASCHKHFVVFSGSQHRRLLPAMCHNLRDGGRCHRRPRLQHLDCCSVNTGSQARYRLRIAISAYPTCIRRPRQGGSRRNCYAVWHGKTRMAWLTDGEKKLMTCSFVLTQLTNVTDRQIDTA